MISEPSPAQEEAITIEPIEPIEKTRKSRGSNADRFKGLPVEKIYLEPSDEEKVCSVCGTPLQKIGTEFVRRELEYVPAKVKVLEYHSVNYGCPSCKVDAPDSTYCKR